MKNLNKLTDLLKMKTGSGEEWPVAQYVTQELEELGFTVKQDTAGNVYAERGVEEGKKVMLLNAHMDCVVFDDSYNPYDFSYGDLMPLESHFDLFDVPSVASNKCCLTDLNVLDGGGMCSRCGNEFSTIDGIFYDYLQENEKECESYELRGEVDESKWADYLSYNHSIWEVYDKVTQEDIEEARKNVDFIIDSYYENKYTKDEEKTIKELKIKVEGDIITTVEDCPLGGDDKCGIFIALEAARLYKDKPMKILFTTEEEAGCVGVSHFCNTNYEWFNNVSFCLTIDRREGDNVLPSQLGKASCSAQNAAKIVQAALSVGIYPKVHDGSVADIIHIRKFVQGVNISAGYYNAHSAKEFIKISDVERIINWVVVMLGINWEV